MPSVFDTNAKGFTRDTDTSIKNGYFSRGNMFLQLTKKTVPAGGQILDYGCGPGRMTLLLARAGFEVLGIDSSQGMIAEAKQQNTNGHRVLFKVGDESGLEANSCDAIICSSVIEYVEKPDQLLQVFRRTLRSGGVLIISYSNSLSPRRLYIKFTGRRNAFATPDRHDWAWRSFKELLTRNGFELVAGPRYFDFYWRFDILLSFFPLGTLGVVATHKV